MVSARTLPLEHAEPRLTPTVSNKSLEFRSMGIARFHAFSTLRHFVPLLYSSLLNSMILKELLKREGWADICARSRYKPRNPFVKARPVAQIRGNAEVYCCSSGLVIMCHVFELLTEPTLFSAGEDDPHALLLRTRRKLGHGVVALLESDLFQLVL